MATTSQEEKQPAGDQDSSSGSDKPVQDPKTVPLEALAEERAKKREAAERADKLAAELAALKEQLAAKKATEPAAQADSDAADIRKAITELRAAEQRRALAGELGLDDKQAQAVQQVMAKAPHLNAAEALHLASFQSKELFASRTANETHPAMHGSLGTSRGAQPQPPADEWKERWKYIDSIKNVDQVTHDQMRNNMIGSVAAKVMGLNHQLIPIPKK